MQDGRERLLQSFSQSSAFECSLSVGGLRVRLDGSESGIPVSLPPNLARFACQDEQCDLALVVRHGRPRDRASWRPLCTSCEGWELWQDSASHYVLTGWPDGREVTVDVRFESGEVLAGSSGEACAGEPFYPLSGIDIVLFANWLANSGDLILHASGVDYEGRAYCFTGPSGAGKSTLARAFEDAGLAVLGEDTVVLRHTEGRFRVFGTPWHEDPALCCPGGAPLEKLFFLDREAAPGIRPLSPGEGVTQLLRTAFVPFYRRDAVEAIVRNLERLAGAVPFYTLSYLLGSDVMELVRRA